MSPEDWFNDYMDGLGYIGTGDYRGPMMNIKNDLHDQPALRDIDMFPCETCLISKGTVWHNTQYDIIYDHEPHVSERPRFI